MRGKRRLIRQQDTPTDPVLLVEIRTIGYWSSCWWWQEEKDCCQWGRDFYPVLSLSPSSHPLLALPHTYTHTHTHTHSHTHWTFLCRNLLQMFSFHISGNSWFHGPHQSQKAPIYKPESRRGWQRSCLDSIPLPTIEKRWITTGVYLTCSHTRLLNPQYNLVLLLEKKRESMGKKWKPK